MKIAFAEPSRPKSGTIVVGVMEDRTLTPTGAALDKESGGAIKRAMESSRFTGRKDEVLAVLAPANLDVGRVLLIGLGKASRGRRGGAAEPAAGKWSPTSTAPARRARRSRSTIVDGAKIKRRRGRGQSRLWRAAALLSLRQVPHQGEARAEAVARAAHGHADDRRRGEARLSRRSTRSPTAVFFTRDLVSEPANVIYPETLADAGADARRARRRGRDARREADERSSA